MNLMTQHHLTRPTPTPESVTVAQLAERIHVLVNSSEATGHQEPIAVLVTRMAEVSMNTPSAVIFYRMIHSQLIITLDALRANGVVLSQWGESTADVLRENIELSQEVLDALFTDSR